MVLANMDGEARRTVVGGKGSGSSFNSSSTLVSVAAESGADGAGGPLGAGGGSALPNRRRLPSGLGDLLAASLSARDRGAARNSEGDVGDFSLGGAAEGSGGVAVFSPSFFLRACAKAASLETLPPASGAPPKSPS